MAVSHTLDFKGVNCILDGSLIRATPIFNCHFCGAINPSEQQFTVNINRDIDVNRLVSFVLPCCGNTVEIFVAAHKTKGLNDLTVCCQRSDAEGAGGIPADWWVRTW